MNSLWPTYFKLSILPLLLSAVYAFNVIVWGFHRDPYDYRWHLPAADAARGRKLLAEHGCIGCHVIPSVPGATGKVGPRLDRFQERVYIAGVIPNSGQNLAYWIQNPREVAPESAMPDLGVGERDARDMAAFLYSLR
jgi:cytochrome c2